MKVSLIWRFYKRHLWDVRLLLFALALALSIGSVLTITLVADRMHQALTYTGQSFLGADRILSDGQPINPDWIKQAQAFGLETQTVVTFVTVLFANDHFELASIRAVPDTYPFYGQLVLTPQRAIQPGEIWLSEQLQKLLNVEIGDWLEMGEARLQVAGLVLQAPEQRLTPNLLAPRAFVHTQSAEKANVIVPGSRVRHRLLLKGNETQIANFSAWVKPRLLPGQRLYGGQDGGTLVSNTLKQAERFFRLSALIGVLLGCLGMSIALYQYTCYQHQQVALLKTLGASRRDISIITGCLILGTIFIGTLSGLCLGWIGHHVLISFLVDMLPAQLPPPSWMPVFLAGCIALLMSLLIAFIPFIKLLKIPVMRVLREDIDTHLSIAWMIPLVMVGNLVLIWLFTNDLQMAFALLTGCLVAVVVLAFAAGLFLLLINKLPQKGSIGLGIRSLNRNLSTTLGQSALVAFALMLVASLWTLQTALLSDLKAQIPKDAPNRFIVNVPMGEQAKIAQFLQERQIGVTQFYPVVRGRLIAINDSPVSQHRDDQGREGVYRELNFTWQDKLPAHNQLVAGQWGNDPKTVSVESGFANRLGIKLGDTLKIRIGTEHFQVTVANLRAVNWQDFRPNFYLIFHPQQMQSFAHSWLAGIRIEQTQQQDELDLIRTFPTSVLIDIENILDRVEMLASQLSRMIALMIGFVMLLSLIVLIIQAQATLIQRYRELVLMRTFGASARFLKQRLITEFTGLGLIAGLSAACATQSMSAYLYHFWLNKPAPFFTVLWLCLPLLGIVVVYSATWPVIRQLLRATLQTRLKQL